MSNNRLRVVVTITITAVLAVQGWLGVMVATLSCRLFHESSNGEPSPCAASECPNVSINNNRPAILYYEDYGLRGYYDVYSIDNECVLWSNVPRETAGGFLHGRTQFGYRLGWTASALGLLTWAALLWMLWTYQNKTHYQSYKKPFHQRTVGMLTFTAWLLFVASSILTLCMCGNFPPLGHGPVCPMEYNPAARVLHVGTLCYACMGILLCSRCWCAGDCCGWCWRDNVEPDDDQDAVPEAMAWVVDDNDETQQQQQQHRDNEAVPVLDATNETPTAVATPLDSRHVDHVVSDAVDRGDGTRIRWWWW